MFSLPPTVRKALLISSLCHFGLFALLQFVLVQKGGSPAMPENASSPELSVEIRHLKPKPAGILLPEPTAEVSATEHTLSEAVTVKAEDDAAFGLEALSPPLYIPVEELNDQPRLIQNIPPEEISGLSQRYDGKVIMRLQINEQGRVDDVAIEETDLAVGELKTLISLFRKTVFSPGYRDGQAVKSEMRIEVIIKTPPPTPLRIPNKF